MKTKTITGEIKRPKNEKQCRLYQNLYQFTQSLSRPKDAAAIQQDKMQCAPAHLLPLIF